MKDKYNQAVVFFKNGKLDKAKDICSEILKEQPDNFDQELTYYIVLFYQLYFL